MNEQSTIGNISTGQSAKRGRGRPRKQLVISTGNNEPSTSRIDNLATGDENNQNKRSSGSGNTGNTGNTGNNGNTGSGNFAGSSDKETFKNVENQPEKETVNFANLFVEEPKKRRGRPKKEKSSTDSKAIASLIIETVDLFATSKLGSNAAFQPTERLLIQPSLEHLITRYGSAADRLSAWIDPVLLLGGIALYVSRISQLVIEKTPINTAVNPSNNGHNPLENVDDNPAVYGVSPDIHDMFTRD